MIPSHKKINAARRYALKKLRKGGRTLPNHDDILRLEGISKAYPGVKALDNVGFSLKKGEVHALVGENGAGKSTLIKCISGAIRPDSGKIFLDNKEFFVHRAKGYNRAWHCHRLSGIKPDSIAVSRRKCVCRGAAGRKNCCITGKRWNASVKNTGRFSYRY